MSIVCPGSDVSITIKKCPQCGEEVELFTGDAKAKCTNCGHLVPRDIAACIDWCPAAKKCYSHVFKEQQGQEDEDKK